MIFKKKRKTEIQMSCSPATEVDETPKVYNGTCKFCKYMEYASTYGRCTKSDIITMTYVKGKGFVFTKWERCDLYVPARHCGTCVHCRERKVIAADKKIKQSYCDAENEIEHLRLTASGKQRAETDCPMWGLRDWKEEEEI